MMTTGNIELKKKRKKKVPIPTRSILQVKIAK
jgi:hypothetical protein